ncbi:hypothetical protein LSTR_LSTR010025 [Laodelphax striatellus]|uniref:Uncharacterized protein n=1 Tax=Laodelphax striatellus TaxID=195883 RepID=A0A482XEV0_LAOST|nr:hypothetical protein LSTR_LSTR010025 [Laodelphax striatellus]
MRSAKGRHQFKRRFSLQPSSFLREEPDTNHRSPRSVTYSPVLAMYCIVIDEKFLREHLETHQSLRWTKASSDSDIQYGNSIEN